MIKKGDLVKMWNGHLVITISESYTHRFMDAEDHEMAAHGMGHMAGTYSGAIDAVCIKTGRKHRLRIGSNNHEVVQ